VAARTIAPPGRTRAASGLPVAEGTAGAFRIVAGADR
jgi:hypothetical protein